MRHFQVTLKGTGTQGKDIEINNQSNLYDEDSVINDTKILIGQTGVQYGSHDKEQSSNTTFVNTEVTEAGVKLDLDNLGINTDISKVELITKDEVVE